MTYNAIKQKALDLIDNKDEICYKIAKENNQDFEVIKNMKWFINAVIEAVK